MAYLKISGSDFSSIVSGLKVGYETLVSSNSGRNAAGDTVIDVINRKIKLYITLRHTTNEEMESFLNALKSYVVDVSFLDPESNSVKTINAYISTPEPEYYTISNRTIFKPLSLNIIEL
jgi:hypothetical protein